MKKIKLGISVFVISSLSVIFSLPAKASLLGTEICGEFHLGPSTTNLFDPDAQGRSEFCKIVTASPVVPEFDINPPLLPDIQFNFDSESIWINLEPNQQYLGWEAWFTELDWGNKAGKIIGVTLENFTGFLPAEVPTISMFDDTSIHFNAAGATIGALGASAHYNIEVKHVPEPTSTLSLLVLSTLGATSVLKRKLKSSQSTKKELEKLS